MPFDPKRFGQDDPPWLKLKGKAWEEYKRREAEEKASEQASVDAEIEATKEAEQPLVDWSGQVRTRRAKEIAQVQNVYESFSTANPVAYVGARGLGYFGAAEGRAKITESEAQGINMDVDVPIRVLIGDKERLVHIDPTKFAPSTEEKPWLKLKGKELKEFEEKEALKQKGLNEWNVAQEQGFGEQSVYLGKDGASFYNPDTKKYVWVAKDKIQEAANGGLFPESKERYLERLRYEMYADKSSLSVAFAGAQQGLTFGLAGLYYKALLGDKEYKKAVDAAQKEHSWAYGLGEVSGTLPWMFVGAGPVGLAAKGAVTGGRAAMFGFRSKDAAALARASRSSWKNIGLKVFGEAALGAEISVGHEFARQTVEGKYDVKKLSKAGAFGGTTFALIGLAGRGIQKIAELGLKETRHGVKELGGEYSDIWIHGRKMRAAKQKQEILKTTNKTTTAATEEAMTDYKLAMDKLQQARAAGATPRASREAFFANQQAVDAAVTEVRHAQAARKSTQAALKRSLDETAKLDADMALLVERRGGILRGAARAGGRQVAARGLGMAIGGGAGYVYGGGDNTYTMIGVLGATLVARPLARRATMLAGKHIPLAVTKGGGKVAKFIGKSAMATYKGTEKPVGFAIKFPILKMSNEELLGTAEILSDESMYEVERELITGYKEAGVDDKTTAAAVNSVTKQQLLLRKYLPIPGRPTFAQDNIKYSEVYDTLKHPEKILERMASFDLSKIDIEIMKELNPQQLQQWRSTATYVLQNTFDLTAKQKRMYELLAGGEHAAKRGRKGKEINTLAFGTREEKKGAPSKADLPKQTTDVQRVQGGLGSK